MSAIDGALSWAEAPRLSPTADLSVLRDQLRWQQAVSDALLMQLEIAVHMIQLAGVDADTSGMEMAIALAEGTA